ncbi:glycosaminoglycan xylosylkinase isoform X1 [Narcine bancroftii]|uniref:glycosaminoglycan xylosylkinase isoform X1 n=1 Tax=Narcine bancroftii TaxID=1343680 RepID=UPI003831A484
MKLKQRVVLLAILLVIFIFTKVFLIDNSDSSLTNREDQHSFQHMIDKLKIELNPNLERTLQSPWEIAAQWVVPREVYPEETPELGAILHAMATKKIIKADVGYKGTQLKALLVLDGGQKVVFKPKRYSRSYVVEGEPYAGYDRHNAEISAFHLDRILGFRRAPVVVGRYVNLNTEIKPVASEQLLSTFLIIGNNSCFYGKCYYCRESEPACADGHVMEGSVTLWLPDIWPLQKHRHPWGRTYREGKLARWEYDESYCDAVKKTPPYDSGPRLLDIIDTAIFDYLIGNADRHHYESFQDDGGASMLILLDNAKSFGTPTLDERSILASVYQCCIIRVSTWNRLNYLKNGVLSTAMRTAMSHDPISPILTDAHLEAMDRRLMSVIATIKQCIEQFGTETVLVEDRMQLSHMK